MLEDRNKTINRIHEQQFPLRAHLTVGFTLLEVLIACLAIAALAGIAIPVMTDRIDKAKNAKAIADILSLQAQISMYKDNNGALPDSLNDLGAAGILDPWDNPYQYLRITGAPGEQPRKDRFLVPVNTDFDLYSKGKNGDSKAPFTAKASRDDIVRASDGAYIGLASEF